MISAQLRDQGNSDSAMIVLDHCLASLPKKAQTAEEEELLGWVYVNRAYLFERYRGDFLSAKSDYLEGLQLFREAHIENFYVARFLYEPLGNIYTRHGENEQAIRMLSQFKRIAKESGDTPALLDAHNDLARAYMNKSEFATAISVLKEGIDLSKDHPYNAGLLYSSLAETYLLNNQLDQGINASEESKRNFHVARSNASSDLMLLVRIENYLVGTLNIEGKLLTRAGHLERARASLNLALKQALAQFPEKHRMIAKIYCALGDLEYVAHHENEAYKLYHLALIGATPDFNETDPDSNPPTEMLFPEVTIGEALQGKATSAKKLGDSISSYTWYKHALDAYQCYFAWENKLRAEQQDFLSKLDFSSEIHENGEAALDILFAMYEMQPSDSLKKIALDIIHQSKAILLSESNAQLLASNKNIKKWVQLLRTQSMQLASFEHNLRLARTVNDTLEIQRTEAAIAQLDQKRQTTLFEIRKKFNDYDALIANNEVPEKQLRKYLKQQQADLLNYFEGKTHTYLVTIGTNNSSFHRASSDSSKQLCLHLRNFLHAPNGCSAKEYESVANRLFQLLVAPAENNLTASNWIVLPDGLLNSIPFEALVSKKHSSPSFKNLRYLVRDKVVHYAPSVEKLLVRNSTSPLEHFLGMAHSFSRSEQLAPLRYSRDEVKTGATVFSGTTYLEEKATKQVFLEKAGQYRVLHLSTHAGIDSTGLEEPWLAFGESPSPKNRLITSELLQLQLSNDLVILNACETGQGNYYAGEGILSFARAFLDAGSRNVLTNLWSVNHTSNHKLIKKFYHNLKQHDAPAKALQKAKLNFLTDGSTDAYNAHPYFWTSLVLMGNNAPTQTPDTNTTSYWLWLTISLAVLLMLLFVFRWRRLRN